MGIDFVVNADCPIKRANGTDTIVRLVKQRTQAESILAMRREEGDDRPPSKITFSRLVYRPEGPQLEEEVNVETLLDETQPLFELAGQCEGCRANILNSAFGCYGHISYPIRASTEKWLLSLLPKDTGSTAGQLFRKFIADFNYDGGPFVQLRQDQMFFDTKEPAVRTWVDEEAGSCDSFLANSSQLFEMMFGVGPIGPPHASLLALFTGMIPNDCDVSLLSNPTGLIQHIDQSFFVQERSLPQITQMTDFFSGLLTAIALDVSVFVDF